MPSRATASTLALLMICVIGGAAHVLCAVREVSSGTRLFARGEAWRAFTADGETMVLDAAPARGLVLEENASIDLDVAPRGSQDAQLSFELLRMMDETHVEMRIGDPSASTIVLKVGPQTSFGVTLLMEREGERPRVLAERKDRDFVGKARRRFALTTSVQADRLEVAIDGEPALSYRADHNLPVGELSLHSRTGALRVLRMSGRSTGSAGSHAFSEDFRGLPSMPLLPVMLRALSQVLLIGLGGMLWVRSLATPPTRGALARASLAAYTPLAIVAVACCANGVAPGRWVLPSAVVGTIAALFVTRRDPREDAKPLTTTRIVDLLLTAALVSAGAVAAYVHRAEVLAPWRSQLALAASDTDPRPFESLRATQLRADNAWTIPGRWRGHRLDATVRLPAGAILEARLRSQGPEGVALFLSASPDMPTSFVTETLDRFTPIGDGVVLVGSDDPRHLTITAEADRFRARLDGVIVAEARERLFPAGNVVLLAALGEVDVDSVSITPIDAPRPPRETWLPAIASCGVILSLLALGLATAWLLRRPWPEVGRAIAFAALPLAVALYGAVGRQAEEGWVAIHAAAAVTLIVALVAVAKARNSSFVRVQAVMLLALVAGACTFHVARTRSWPASVARQNSMTYLDWDVDRLTDGLEHLQHPLMRRWNFYLTDHRFKRRDHALAKPPGTTRVLALGSSSTFGYGTDADYPTLAGEQLRRDGVAVEVINAAFNGAVGDRLLRALKNDWLAFDPDVVTLSLYYNDSVNLTQADEAAYLSRVTRPDYRRTWLDDLREKARLTAGEPRFSDLNRRHVAANDTTATRWDVAGLTPPPERFEAMLTEFAELGRAHGFQLVLIKEPVAGARPRLWKDEFYAAMDRVAARYALKVVDPTPALLDAGGAALFSDEVHPYADGHAVIAGVLAPVLRRVIEER